MFTVFTAPEIKGIYGLRMAFEMISDKVEELEKFDYFRQELLEEFSSNIALMGNGMKVEFRLGCEEEEIKAIIAAKAKKAEIEVIFA